MRLEKPIIFCYTLEQMQLAANYDAIIANNPNTIYSLGFGGIHAMLSSLEAITLFHTNNDSAIAQMALDKGHKQLGFSGNETVAAKLQSIAKQHDAAIYTAFDHSLTISFEKNTTQMIENWLEGLKN